MTRNIAFFILASLLLLSGCIPSTLQPFYYGGPQAFPEEWAGEYVYLEKGKDVENALLVLQKTETGGSFVLSTGEEGYRGDFQISLVPGTTVYAATCPQFILYSGGKTESVENALFFLEKQGDTLYIWDLLRAPLSNPPWREEDVKDYLKKNSRNLIPRWAGLTFRSVLEK